MSTLSNVSLTIGTQHDVIMTVKRNITQLPNSKENSKQKIHIKMTKSKAQTYQRLFSYTSHEQTNELPMYTTTVQNVVDFLHTCLLDLLESKSFQ